MTGKTLFDKIFSVTAIVFFGWVILLGWILAAIDTRKNGFFFQDRIGKNAKPFTIIKLRTMRTYPDGRTEVSVLGKLLRKIKIDEFPQFFNVLAGDMSMVGPRPDVPGYYDLLKGNDRKILELRPGITGAASLKYANEEALLELQENPQDYNDNVIFPDKIRINLLYQQNQSLWIDCKIIIYTIFGKDYKEDFFE